MMKPSQAIKRSREELETGSPWKTPRLDNVRPPTKPGRPSSMELSTSRSSNQAFPVQQPAQQPLVPFSVRSAPCAALWTLHLPRHTLRATPSLAPGKPQRRAPRRNSGRRRPFRSTASAAGVSRKCSRAYAAAGSPDCMRTSTPDRPRPHP